MLFDMARECSGDRLPSVDWSSMKPTLVSLISPAEKLFARVAVPGGRGPKRLGVLLPPITPNIPAGEPRPESG